MPIKTINAIFFLIFCIAFGVAVPMIFFNPVKGNKAPLQLSFKDDQNVQRDTNSGTTTDLKRIEIDRNGVDQFNRPIEDESIKIENAQPINANSIQIETNQTELQTVAPNLQTISVTARRIVCVQSRPFNLRHNIESLSQSSIVAVLPCNTLVYPVNPPVIVTNELSTWQLLKYQNRYVWISTLAFKNN